MMSTTMRANRLARQTAIKGLTQMRFASQGRSGLTYFQRQSLPANTIVRYEKAGCIFVYSQDYTNYCEQICTSTDSMGC